MHGTYAVFGRGFLLNVHEVAARVYTRVGFPLSFTS